MATSYLLQHIFMAVQKGPLWAVPTSSELFILYMIVCMYTYNCFHLIVPKHILIHIDYLQLRSTIIIISQQMRSWMVSQIYVDVGPETKVIGSIISA